LIEWEDEEDDDAPGVNGGGACIFVLKCRRIDGVTEQLVLVFDAWLRTPNALFSPPFG
jgi:hypothetical protein